MGYSLCETRENALLPSRGHYPWTSYMHRSALMEISSQIHFTHVAQNTSNHTHGKELSTMVMFQAFS